MNHNRPPTKILYAEDHPDIRRVISQMLTMFGCEVRCAENGCQAVEQAIGWRPDAILMDVRMPLMDGLEATRRIRRQPETAHIPIVMLSAHNDRASRDACLMAGANAFLSKPTAIETVMAKIEQVMVSNAQ